MSQLKKRSLRESFTIYEYLPLIASLSLDLPQNQQHYEVCTCDRVLKSAFALQCFLQNFPNCSCFFHRCLLFSSFFLDMSFRVTIFVSCQFLAADPAHQEASRLGGDILCVGYGF